MNSLFKSDNRDFGDGLIVLALTSVAYLSAYVYQAAYLHYYGIDYSAVRISIEAILSLGTLICLTFLFIAPSLRAIGSNGLNRLIISEKGSSNIFIVLGFDFVVSLILFFGVIATLNYTGFLVNSSLKTWILLPLVFLNRIAPAINNSDYRKAKTKKAKIKAYASIQNKYAKVDLACLFIVGMIFLFASAGNSHAKDKDRYEYISHNKAVISEGGNYLIAAEVSGNKLTGNYELINITSQARPLVFSEKRIKLLNNQ